MNRLNLNLGLGSGEYSSQMHSKYTNELSVDLSVGLGS